MIARAGLGTVVLLATACGGSKVSDELRRDLDLASSDGLQLAGMQAGAEVVSAIEQIPNGIPAAAGPRRTPAPRPPAPTPEAPIADEPSPEPEVEPVAAPVVAIANTSPVEDAGAPSARPRPMEPRYPVGGGGGGVGGGEGSGPMIGPVIVVIRGGTNGRDPCPPGGHPGSARPGIPGGVNTTGGVAINNRIPPIGRGAGIGRPTFPRY